jgi:hypothetical protein
VGWWYAKTLEIKHVKQLDFVLEPIFLGIPALGKSGSRLYHVESVDHEQAL